MEEERVKTEEEIRQEVRQELQEEQEKKELNGKKKRSIVRIISSIIFILLFLFILFETIIGIIDMQKINDNKEPIWYINSKTEKSNGKTETIYNLGLYVIVKTNEGNKSETVLKPFFLK